MRSASDFAWFVLVGATVFTAGPVRAQAVFRTTIVATGQEREPQRDRSRSEFPSLGDPIERIKPIASGAGVVICDPVSEAGVDSETANFGAGCGRWLQFVIGGQGELGKTPLWEGLDRARRELGRPDLRLKPAELGRLVTLLGVTHAAAGTLRGGSGQCTLTYQLWQIPGQKPAGAAVTASGTKEQILEKLPALAIALSRQLGVSAPHIPATVGATPAEMALMGQQTRETSEEPTDAQAAKLEVIAGHTPLAAMMLLDTMAVGDQSVLAAVVKTCLETAPGNALVYSQIGASKPDRLVSCQSKLLDLCRQYPANAPLALAASRLYSATQQAEQQRHYAERAVEASCNCPDTWTALSTAYMMEAQYVRQGRTYSSLSTEEVAYVTAAYGRWMQAGTRATQLDDQDARAWLDVAKAATFAAQPGIADLALAAAMRLAPRDPQTYIWALQMYAPKWRSEPVKLRETAERAAKVPFASTSHSLSVVDALISSGFPELAKQLTTAVITKQEEIVRNRPTDVMALRLLGAASFRTNRYPAGLAAYRKVAELTPNDARAQFELGRAYQLNSQLDNALPAFQQAVRLTPDYTDAHARLADLLQTLHKNAEAIVEYQALLRLSPRYELAYEQLAGLLVDAMRPREAMEAARSAVKLNGASSRAHELLGEAYLLGRQFDESVIELREAIRLNPDNQTAKQKLDEALNK